MEETNIQNQIDSINQKLDIILEEIELQRKHRREMDDLKDDLTRIGKDLYQTTVVELEEMHDQINSGDILHFTKKLLRNITNLTKTFEQLENVRGFLQDAAPLTRHSFIDLMNKLDEFDRKGYFQFIKELGNVVDKVVTSFTIDDVKNLGDNVVTILNTVKNLTQPDMLHAINNAVSVYKKLDIEISENVSFFSLIKEINTPEMKKGLAFGIKFLKSMAVSNGQSKIVNINNAQTN
ncbi:MAG: helical membrane plugin domain-containing protein [Ignavibacteriaceae bacterium]